MSVVCIRVPVSLLLDNLDNTLVSTHCFSSLVNVTNVTKNVTHTGHGPQIRRRVLCATEYEFDHTQQIIADFTIIRNLSFKAQVFLSLKFEKKSRPINT